MTQRHSIVMVISVNTEWLIPYERNTQPPKVYFCQSKLDVWANVADQALEAVKHTRSSMDPFFDDLHRNVSAQLTGKIFSFIKMHTYLLNTGI